MIENLIYSSPLFVLVAGFMLLFGEALFDSEKRRSFQLSRLVLLISGILAVIFYNRTAFAEWAHQNLFSLLFQILSYAAAFATLYLSRKWYSSMNESGYSFCRGLLLSVLAGYMLVISADLGFTTLAVGLLMCSNYLLLSNADKKKEVHQSCRIYAVGAVIFWLLLLAITAVLYILCGDLKYETLQGYFVEHQDETVVFCLASALVLTFIFLLGLAPLYYWFTATMGQIILPVFTYFVLVPVCAGWGAFMRLNASVLDPLSDLFYIFYTGAALISIGIGAVGACSGKNIYKIFAYSTVYHFGIVLLMLQRFSFEAANSAFIYLFIYLLAMFGICSSLFGIKSKGEYLTTLSDFEGAAQKRPYISAMMTIFLFSLIGFPPFLGFMGTLAVFNEQVQNNHFYQLLYVFAALLIVVYAYLQIVKTLYFENSNESFDRADTGIYMAIFLNAVLMIFMMLRPLYFVHDIDVMLGAVLQ